MINYLIDQGVLGAEAAKQNQKFIEDYNQGNLNFEDFCAFALAPYIGMDQASIDELIEPFLKDVINPLINVFALKLIHDHKDKNDVLLLASATNELIVRPIARRLEIENVIGTRVEFKYGKCTGRFIPPAALGEGKLILVQEWMQEHQWNDFSNTTFYSDSINDLPLLKAVANPKPTNPDEKLERIAQAQEWAIINLPKI